VKGLRKVLAPELDAIALRCLEKKPSARYLSVDAVLADIDRWLGGEAVLARAPGAWYRFGKFANRHRLAVGLGAMAVFSLAVVAAVAVVFGLQAREESARAGAARDFMLSLFRNADQEKARAADITARELLETGRNDLLKRLATQPRLQAELLSGIGAIQKGMGEYVGANSTFADAARIYEQMHMPREAALARAGQADAAVRMGDMKLATTVLRQAKDVADRPVNDAELNALLNEVEGWIALSSRDSARARGLFLVSYELAVKSFGPHHIKTIDALRGRFYAERDLRNFDEAVRLLDQVDSAVAAAGSMDPVAVAASARDRTVLLLNAGKISKALDHVLAALPKCISDLGPNHAECRELTFRKVNTMLQLGMSSRAAEELPSLRLIAKDLTSPTLAGDTLLLILKIESTTGTSAEKRAAFEEVRSMVEGEAGAALGLSLKVKAMLGLAEFRLREGAPFEAERWIQRAAGLQRQESGLMPLTKFAALTKSLQGIAKLQGGHAEESLRIASAAHEDFLKLYGPNDPVTSLISLNRALSLEALGQYKEARSVVDGADPIVLRAAGIDAPVYLRLRTLNDRLEREIRQPESAFLQGARLPATDSKTNRATSTDFF
jgi:eukaryotic-like serine/threonine-protein kinase